MNRDRNSNTSDSSSNNRWQPMPVGLLIIYGLLINSLCIFLYPQPAQFVYLNIQQISKSLFHYVQLR